MLIRLDITSENAVIKSFQNKNPDCVINCAAYTAVDKAETDSETAGRKVQFTGAKTFG
jgi:dTDP-4-dehydrorhamnose reductase